MPLAYGNKFRCEDHPACDHMRTDGTCGLRFGEFVYFKTHPCRKHEMEVMEHNGRGVYMSNSEKVKSGYNPKTGDGEYDPGTIPLMKDAGNASSLGALKICSHVGRVGCTKDCDHNKPHRNRESCKSSHCRFVNSNCTKCVNVDTLGDVPTASKASF